MAPAWRFAGRTALVTGGAGGIGAAVAARFATEGADVVVADTDKTRLDAVVTGIGAQGGTAFGQICDVTRPADIEAAVDAAVTRCGRLDLLVTCAGLLRDNLLASLTDSDWDLVVDTHLNGTFRAARAAHRPMIRQGYGRMVFLSSIATFGNRGQANYSSAKGGIEAMARTLSLELGPFGITVNTLAPGFVDTAMTKSVAERGGVDYQRLKEAAAKATPRRRVASAQEMAAIVAFLCSDEADFITGQTIVARGGP